jgi:hypothetical protein
MANSTADSSFATYGLENELSGYKALSGAAIFSAAMGLLSLLMFVDSNFFFIPLLAVFFGFKALRKIKMYPNTFTGLKLAQAGIGLAVVFTLVSFCIGIAYQFILNKDVRSYGESLAEVLKTRRAEDILFLRLPESQREDMTPDKFVAQRLESGPEGKMALDTELKPIQALVAERDASGANLVFDQIEMAGYDKLTPFAYLRYSISGGAPHEHKEGDGHDHKEGEAHDDHGHAAGAPGEPLYAMVQIKAEKANGKTSWYISEFVYPYKKGSAKPKAEAVDDGHGHAH